MKGYKIIIIVLIIVLSVWLILLWLLPPIFKFKEAKEQRIKQVRLLCQTDYNDLLNACREYSRHVEKGELIYYHFYEDPNEEIPKFPKAILDLEPRIIIIDPDGRIQIELGLSFAHFGVQVYPEDYNVPFSGFEYGDRELIDGLWYYDDGYQYNPDYDNKIDAFIEKYKEKGTYGR